MSKKVNVGSDLQGLIRMAQDATLGITDIVEAMHRQVVQPPFLPSTPFQKLIFNIAGFTYHNIKGSTKLIGGGLDKILGHLNPLIGEVGTTQERELMVSVLNGILGDYLEERANPLAIKMQLRPPSETEGLNLEKLDTTYPNAHGHLLLMVHGSCMSDLQWTRNGHNHGVSLATDLGLSPLNLHYNSGRHISHNGQSLSDLLEELVVHWPVPIEQLTILSHSMGGLVTRSAVHYGQVQQKSWMQYLDKMVFLGTPHQGAQLERFGNYLDVILESIPYARPFARLGKIRSPGVTDLRYGNLIDEDWQGRDRFAIAGDRRTFIPLPESVDCYSIAAVAGKAKGAKPLQNRGDRLVNVGSALGQHKDSEKDLNFKKENTWVAYETGHLDLLNSPSVYAQLKSWLAD